MYALYFIFRLLNGLLVSFCLRRVEKDTWKGSGDKLNLAWIDLIFGNRLMSAIIIFIDKRNIEILGKILIYNLIMKTLMKFKFKISFNYINNFIIIFLFEFP